MMFYAPGRALAEVRERAPLGQALLLALVAQSVYWLYIIWPHLSGAFAVARGGSLIAWQVFSSLLFTLIIFVPVLIAVANLLERRGGVSAAIRQEYAAAASAVLYARAAASLLSLPFVALMRVTGGEAKYYEQTREWLPGLAAQNRGTVEQFLAEYPLYFQAGLANTFLLPLFAALVIVAVWQVFRVSFGRAVAVVAISVVSMLPALYLFGRLFDWVFASPFLLVMLFLLMRGYIGEVLTGQRARAAFRQNLETATLNPADASAHYNLGLLHLQRREIGEARTRFERAIEIDPEEVDAHYQLGRIARAEGRWADAIRHYSEALTRNPAHAQHEVWREAAATYVSAGQFADAEGALERFFEHRQLDPEGLYLMGRTQFGLGRARESREWMQRCIEAVRTAPAYKYRAERRWLSEAQQFLRTLA